MDYWYERLAYTSQRRSPHITGNVIIFGDRLELRLRERNFHGLDGGLVYNSLRSSVREVDLAAMRDAQEYLILLRMLKKAAYEHFEATGDRSAAEEGGATCWPEAVQYLWSSRAAPHAISQVLTSLKDLKQARGGRKHLRRLN